MTPTNNNPNQPNIDPNNIDPKVLVQAIDQVLAAREQTNPQHQPPSQPLTLNVNGQPQTFTDPNQVANLFNQRQQEYEQMKQQYQESQQQLNQFRTQQQQPQTPTTPPTKPAVDMEKFIDLLAKDPIEAFDYVDNMRYGYNPVQVNQQALAKIIDMNNVMQSNMFKEQVPEYEESEHNANTLYNLLQRNNMGWTASNLRLAYDHAKNNGLLKTEEVKNDPYNMNQENNNNPTYPNQSGYNMNQQHPQNQQFTNTMPPSVGRGNGGTYDATSDLESRFRGMSASEMEQVIRRMEGTGYR